MRIPLDFYQILGVPIQATSEQIQQAFDDRHQQLPRQEYSQAAIDARNQLLQNAHELLCEPDQRAAYDAKILTTVDLASSGSETSLPPSDPEDVGIELADALLVGALMLLHDLGEYELIIQMGAAHLNRDIDLSHLPTDTVASDADVVLAMALAYLESGRDNWHQSQFKLATAAFNTGLELLLQEQLFLDLQDEFKLELAKLRPYRILELLALPLDQPEREQGFILLQEMLQERGGLDGSHLDRSGLSVDDFLRFVQQVRGTLTVAEQQTLFAPEKHHPSDVASFLSVYTLVAGGVVQRHPTQIQQARTLLTQLADRQQDLYLEQAMCDLLLGQPRPALQALRLSQDQDSLAFIHQYSQGSEDLVPGLFIYTERWLQQEVYPYFRDLSATQVSLQDYFNDEQLQAELSQLAPLPEPTAAPAPAPISPLVDATLAPWAEGHDQQLEQEAHQKPQSPKSVSLPTEGTTSLPPLPFETAGMKPQPRTSWQHSPIPPPVEPATVAMDQVLNTEANRDAGAELNLPSGVRETPPSEAVTPRSGRRPSLAQQRQQQQAARKSSRPSRRQPWLPWAVALLFGGLGVGAVMAVSQNWGSKSEADPSPVLSPDDSSAASSGTQASPQLPSPTPQVSPKSNRSSPDAAPLKTSTPPEVLSQAEALKLVQRWQQVKAQAMGKQHDGSQLQSILAEPVLSVWQDSAQVNRANQKYWTYTLGGVEIKTVTPTGANQVKVLAEVKETAQSYQQGVLQPDSYTDNYTVQYDLVRQDGQWLIKDMK